MRLERFLTRFERMPCRSTKRQLEPLYGLVSASGENELSQKILKFAMILSLRSIYSINSSIMLRLPI